MRVWIWPLVLVHAASNLLVLAEASGFPVWWEAGQLAVTLLLGL